MQVEIFYYEYSVLHVHRSPRKNIMGEGGGGRKGGSESLRISFLEAVYGFRVSFLSLCIFLGYELNVMAVSGAVCTSVMCVIP